MSIGNMQRALSALGGRAAHARLQRAAVRYAQHGWDVIPGACLDANRFYCGPGCATVACHPAFVHGEALLHPARSSRDPQTVSEWWQRLPHTILLATGTSVDVLEVPAHLGTRWPTSANRGPVAMTPTGRYMLFVAPGTPLRSRLAQMPDVVLHGQGSWVPAPPTATTEGRVRWLVAPAETSWQLPDSDTVQQYMIDALPRVPSPRTSTAPLGAAA